MDNCLRSVLATVLSILAISAPPPAAAAPGDLDPGFGTDGKVVTAVGGPSDARAVAIQPDGKIVVAGRGLLDPLGPQSGNFTDLALARYHADGTRDQAFGTGGLVFTDVGPVDRWSAVVLQPDGKIVVGGGSGNTLPTRAVLGRFNPDGSPDATFGTGGVVTTDFGDFGCGDQSEGIRRLVLQPGDGKIVVAVECSSDFGVGGVPRFLVARYNANGRSAGGSGLDTSFGGGDGVATPLDDGLIADLALQPDGKIVAVALASWKALPLPVDSLWCASTRMVRQTPASAATAS